MSTKATLIQTIQIETYVHKNNYNSDNTIETGVYKNISNSDNSNRDRCLQEQI